jgi:hypothetical protein
MSQSVQSGCISTLFTRVRGRNVFQKFDFRFTASPEVRTTPTRLGLRPLRVRAAPYLRATPYPAIQLLEDRLAVLVALLVIANLPKIFGGE